MNDFSRQPPDQPDRLRFFTGPPVIVLPSHKPPDRSIKKQIRRAIVIRRFKRF
jgi:hypothetical protein